ncbi:hypothetical protein Isop_3040 [Isosphaera pallida ATCC 43644]|uniref:O-antigen polymerase n=1 Tax=Isosphaera pallida (strain ATCC 43644 / DSM 9630 / IS1B) TaxID=575540 RepID=E8R395_ISOPI|nr:O-antigen ligase family protein [Isosphaera pallida]ADV63605.1 hypothetical protein Isop_3040 [Isosphaera pallida ATCC 43644]
MPPTLPNPSTKEPLRRPSGGSPAPRPLSPAKVRTVLWLDRAFEVNLVGLIVGSILALGGTLWWSEPILAGGIVSLGVIHGVRGVLRGTQGFLKGPLTLLLVGVAGLGLAQSIPLPASLAGLLTPDSAAFDLGFPPSALERDDPAAGELAEGKLDTTQAGRRPATLDRHATLRATLLTLGTALVAMVVGQTTQDRRRLTLILGTLAAMLGINTLLALIQTAGHVPGWMGIITPGTKAPWSPSWAELAAAPGATRIHPWSDAPPALNLSGTDDDLVRVDPGRNGLWLLTTPDATSRFLIGTMPGGAAGYLALAAVGLPLTLALTIHTLSARGSREPLMVRLSDSGRWGVALALGMATLGASLMCATLGGFGKAGPILGVTLLVGLALTRTPGCKASAWALSGLVLLFASLGGFWRASGDPPAALIGFDPSESAQFATLRRDLSDAWIILQANPILGVGLGAFGAIHPYVKTGGNNLTAAPSGWIHFAAEAGVIGLTLAVIGLIWIARRLPTALRRVGPAEQPLAWALLGAGLGLGVYSLVGWTVQAPALALVGAVLLGATHRWLCGGLDQFVAVT